MKRSSFLFVAMVSIVSLGLGLWMGQSRGGAAPRARQTAPEAPAKISASMIPSTEDLKLWTRYQELISERKLPDPKELEKLSDEKKPAKLQEIQEQVKKQEEGALLKLHNEFPSMKATDIPLVLRRVQEFIAVITPRYYKLQEQEVARLQAAGAFSDAALPLIKEEALKQLAAEFPTVGEAGIKQLLRIQE